ncbi:MAG: M48 family metalloprotease [Gammaproteobacteria bacterium]|nr:M48 family metalloprotease [Gammaproteobacteria bacterium]
MDTTDAVTGMMVSGYGRDAELEADRIGGELIAKAGYNPYAVIEMVQVLKDQELFEKSISGGRQTYHGLFATHPKNDKRLHEAVQVSYQYVPNETVEPIEDMWEMLDGLVYGDEAAEGIVKEQTFYNSSVRIVVTFPAAWSVTNTRTQVVGQAPGGGSKGEITIAQQTQVKGQDPAEYVKKTLKRDDVVSGESLKVNEFDAYIADLDVADGKLAVSMLAVVFKDGAVYFFKGSADPGADADAFRADFKATVATFRAMAKEDVAVANRQRIKVIEATPKDSYASLAKQSSIKRYPVETLRLLNADFPNGEPRPGDRIKTVQ